MDEEMFVIGGNLTSSCEVFDSHSRKITAMKSEIKLSAKDLNIFNIKLPFKDLNIFNEFCIGYNIVVFHQHIQSGKTIFCMYDVNKSRWSQINYSFLKNYIVFSYVKYYVQWQSFCWKNLVVYVMKVFNLISI